jgi:hypothetical protein
MDPENVAPVEETEPQVQEGAQPAVPEVPPPEEPGVRDTLQSLGFDASHLPDDSSALAHLVAQAREAESLRRRAAEQSELARYGQHYLQHAEPFQKFLKEQQDRQQKPQRQVPEWNPAWERFLEQDPQTGRLKVAEGADPTLLQKYQSRQQWERDQLRGFLSDPQAFLKDYVAPLVQEQAQQLVQQQLGGFQAQNFAQQFVQQHGGWLYARDEQGNTVPDGRGQPALSPWGQKFEQYLGLARDQFGIADPRARAAFALNQCERENALLQLQQLQQGAQAQQNGRAKKQAFLAQDRQRPGVEGSVPAAGKGKNQVQNRSVDLGGMLRTAMEGVTDDEVNASLSGVKTKRSA